MAAEQFANQAQTTLASSIANNTATSISVSNLGVSPFLFPSVAQFRILVDFEIMIVTAGAGTTTWTVTRGAEGSTAVSHITGSTVTHLVTAGSLSAFARTDKNTTFTTDAYFKSGKPWVDPFAYGAVGDGVTNDTTALQAAINAGPVFLPACTYMIGSKLTLTNSLFCAPGATIKKLASFADTTDIYCNGTANLIIEGLTIDGNRLAGATGEGIWWNAATGGVLRNVKIKSNASHGLSVESGAELSCHNVDSSDNVSGSGTTLGSACGFVCVGSNSKLRQWNCIANDNDGSGTEIRSGSADGCLIDLRANRNLRSAVRIRNNNGTIRTLIGGFNNRYGLEIGNSGSDDATQGWQINYVELTDTGAAFSNTSGAVSANPSGTSIEMFGASYFEFGTIVSRDPLGYGLAIAVGSALNSSYNRFGSVLLDQSHAADGDPGLHMSGNSIQNHFGNLEVNRHTFAVSFGEGLAGIPQDNIIHNLSATDCHYGIIRIENGAYNRFHNIIGRDCYTADTALATALIFFKGSGSTNNVIDSFSHRVVSNPAPNKLFDQITSASGNYIQGKGTSLERDGWKPSGTVIDSFSRIAAPAALSTAQTSGTLHLAGGFTIPAGATVSSATFYTGSTAMVTPTHQWFCLVRVSDRAILAVTADDTTTAWGTLAAKTLSFATPWIADTDTPAWVGVMIAAATPPNLLGVDYNNVPSVITVITPVLSGTSNTAQTTPLTVGTIVTAPTNHRNHPYCYVS